MNGAVFGRECIKMQKFVTVQFSEVSVGVIASPEGAKQS